MGFILLNPKNPDQCYKIHQDFLGSFLKEILLSHTETNAENIGTKTLFPNNNPEFEYVNFDIQ